MNKELKRQIEDAVSFAISEVSNDTDTSSFYGEIRFSVSEEWISVDVISLDELPHIGK